MSIFYLIIFFIVYFAIGYLIVKSGFKLRYLAPLSFLIVFSLVLFVLSILFPNDWYNVKFFSINGPNQLAIDTLLISFFLSLLVTSILILVVWAIRKNIF